MADLLPRGVTLAFDTSGPACCAALLDRDAVLVERVEAMARGQAERLIPLLQDLLAEAGLDWRDVARIGVGTGPGNFTGIRISVAAARGLALSLSRPALGVGMLVAMKQGLPRPCLTVVGGRRGTVYLQRHDHDHAAPHAPMCLALDDPTTGALPPLPICGDMAAEIARRTGGSVVPPVAPLAVSIARIAAGRPAVSGERPRPVYVRAADAAPVTDLPPPILPGPPRP